MPTVNDNTTMEAKMAALDYYFSHVNKREPYIPAPETPDAQPDTAAHKHAFQRILTDDLPAFLRLAQTDRDILRVLHLVHSALSASTTETDTRQQMTAFVLSSALTPFMKLEYVQHVFDNDVQSKDLGKAWVHVVQAAPVSAVKELCEDVVSRLLQVKGAVALELLGDLVQIVMEKKAFAEALSLLLVLLRQGHVLKSGQGMVERWQHALALAFQVDAFFDFEALMTLAPPGTPPAWVSLVEYVVQGDARFVSAWHEQTKALAQMHVKEEKAMRKFRLMQLIQLAVQHPAPLKMTTKAVAETLKVSEQEAEWSLVEACRKGLLGVSLNEVEKSVILRPVRFSTANGKEQWALLQKQLNGWQTAISAALKAQ